jgi:hypothetical protein
VQDKKAQKILFKTYWSSAGWKSKPSVTSDDYNYALKAGYMFKPLILSHDEIVDWVIKVVKNIIPLHVSNAFLCSLNNRRLNLRSALGSYAIARHFPHHKFSGKKICDICGEYRKPSEEDLSVLNFERLKWGGVRHLSPVYVAFDLEKFTQSQALEPTLEDFERFNAIIKTAQSLDNNARPRDLEKAISKIINSNEAERTTLIEILGYCGILQPQKQKSFFESFVNDNEREERPVGKIDWTYPVSWWKGSDGVNKDALAYYFPQLGFST